MLYHDSRDPIYRAPGGALPCGAEVTLRLRAKHNPDWVVLRLWRDNREERLEMRPVGDDLYEYTLALPRHPGLLWYYFVAAREGVELRYGNASDQLGGVGEVREGEPPSFQITVYDPAYETPEWMREGVLYQIMVDRFRASGRAPMRGHADWREPPLLRVNGNGDNEADDFFGGDLAGLREKLPYLKELGVTALYLNPIFEARSNHKYDTGDYKKIDPAFGDEAAFQSLCRAAEGLGIRVILDGVFSHTGSDSRYFNRFGRYDGLGAYQSLASPYASWYTFRHWPDDYESWWGFETLPTLNKMDAGCLRYLIGDEDAVCLHWLRAGASGWRLDVADELPMPFLRLLRRRVKAEKADGALLGEVWEDASRKVAYGELRAYCLGDTLDSCMNYPLREALLDFLLGKIEARNLTRRILSLAENYAPQFFYSLMNMLGSHDKPRIINVLSGAPDQEPPREQRRSETLSPAAYALGRKRFAAAWRFLCALPGMPCLYYGDEAGATGMADPFCRGTYPWGDEDHALLSEIAGITRTRRESPARQTGEMRLYAPCADVAVCARRIANGRDAFGRERPDECVVCALNRADEPRSVALPADDFLPRGFSGIVPPLAAEEWAIDD